MIEIDFYINLTAIIISVILLFICYVIPVNNKPIIVKVYSDTITDITKFFFRFMICFMIFYNLFLYFTLPSVFEQTIGTARQNKDTVVTQFESGKKFVFGEQLYDIITSDLEKIKFRDVTNFVWNNLFFINSMYFLFISVYILLLKLLFGINLFTKEY
jgi:hypothetical protein